MSTTSEVPVGLGFTPFEDRLDVIDRLAAHAELKGLAFVSVAEAMSWPRRSCSPGWRRERIASG